MSAVDQKIAIGIREIGPKDLEQVIRLDALHTGEAKRAYWRDVFRSFLRKGGGANRVGLAAQDGSRMVGYLLGEVRAFEFGSEPCGWIFAVGVDTGRLREGIASALLGEAASRFRSAGVGTVRTMVRREAVPVMSFFRSNGFVGGSFVQLEMSLDEEGRS